VTVEMISEADASTAASAVVDERLVSELMERASAEGVSLTGEGGLLQQLTKLVLEASLEGEMDAHLGYGKHAALTVPRHLDLHRTDLGQHGLRSLASTEVATVRVVRWENGPAGKVPRRLRPQD
jgi:hypothetical protein